MRTLGVLCCWLTGIIEQYILLGVTNNYEELPTPVLKYPGTYVGALVVVRRLV